ncbi:MAG: site-specific integrase [Sphingobacterium sp.]|nr:site-specific integrase [Sphingobacterium sp.]
MKEQNNANENLLNHVLDGGIIDLAYLSEQCEIMRRKEILKHYNYWYNERKEVWLWHKPDITAQSGRRQVKRKRKEDIEQYIIEYHLGEHKPQENILTVRELVYEFLEWKKELVRGKTITVMLGFWRKYYEPQEWFVEKPIDEVIKLDFDKVHAYILDNYTTVKKGEGHVKATASTKAFNNIKGVIKQAFEYAVDDAEYLDTNPYRVKVDRKKVSPNRKKENEKAIFFPLEQLAIIQDLEKQSEDKQADTSTLACIFCFETGLRSGELLALKSSDVVNRDGNKYLKVQRQQVDATDVTDIHNPIARTGFEVVNYAKSECGIREIPLTDKALQIIEQVEKINRDYHKQVEDYLFTKDNSIVPPYDAIHAMERACRSTNIPIRRMHAIRKTYASNLYANGVSVPIISKLLGHADEQTTLRNYIFDLQTKDEAYHFVIKALKKPKEVIKATKGNQKVIPIQSKKKVG